MNQPYLVRPPRIFLLAVGANSGATSVLESKEIPCVVGALKKPAIGNLGTAALVCNTVVEVKNHEYWNFMSQISRRRTYIH